MKKFIIINSLFKQGINFINSHELMKAQKTFEEITKLDGRNADAWHLLGVIAAQSKKPEEAAELFYKAIRINPQNSIFHCNRGIALKELNRIEEAIICFDKAIQLDGNYALAYNNKGLCLHGLNLNNDALICFEKAIELKNDNPDAWFNLALTYEALNQYENALACYSKAVEINSKFSRAYFFKAKLLKKMMRLKEALQAYTCVIEIAPNDYEAYSNRGNILADLNLLGEAIASFDSAITINPKYYPAYSNKGIAYLRNCDFENGWPLYENRWKSDFFKIPKEILEKPQVTHLSQSSAKKILIWPEQGIGDQIMYGSLINEALNVFEDVQIMADKRLLPLYERSIPGGVFIDDKTPLAQIVFEEHIPMGNLARFFRNSKKEFENSKKYLFPDANEVLALRQKLPKNKKLLCGISWNSSNQFFGSDKSLTLNNLLPLFKISDVEFVNLQYGDVSNQIEELKNNLNIELKQVLEIDNFENLDGLASLIQACDFVVTVSNSTAHLSGALGKETYLLYAKGNGSLWYWSNANDGRSLWYPSVEVHQQENAGQWAEVVNSVSKKITKKYLN